MSPKCSVYIRVENIEKWEAIPNKAEWVNSILSEWSKKDIQHLIPYHELQERVVDLEKRMALPDEVRECAWT